VPIAHPASRAYRVIAWIVRQAVHLVVKTQWSGAQSLPSHGGFIAASNHATEADALSFAVFLFENGHEPRILAKRGLFTTPILGSLMRATKMIPVDRGTSAAGHALAVGHEELDAGACVAIFPEGTLTRDPDLWPMEGKTGLARLALAARVPVIPVAQWGMNDFLPRYGRRPRLLPRPHVRVHAGPAVDLADLYDRPQDTVTLREATSRVMDAIARELEPLRGGQAPQPRFDLHKHPEYNHKQTHYPPVPRP
jgi:1-acyl-sn-glycerol-3-phosphate acyltransferase